jgi:tRNA G18 (ribose-2'-O)-methylase SpoU
VGEEGPGLKLSPEQKKKMNFVSIPTQRIESLNATISATLAIWEWRKNN